MNSKTIALITDFGIDDPYVGIMKGIISELSPDSPLIDITNTIPPGDIQRGAFVLWQAVQDFPKGTIFLCVVDPGVGTERKPIFLHTGDQIYIGPDNGLPSYLLYKSNFTCWELSNPEYQRENSSTTFHGRDIFAPAAGYAAISISGNQFGPQLTSLNKLPKPTLSNNERSLAGEILSQDHYGNLFTSLGVFEYKNDSLHYRSWIDNGKLQIDDPTKIRIRVTDQQLPLVRTFASIGSGMSAGLIGSTGLLEIVANQSSAKTLLGIEKGTSVSLVWE